MTAPILAAACFCLATTAIHFVSIVIAGVRLRRNTSAEPPPHQEFPPVSLVRPLCGIDNYAAETLRTSFELDYPCCEILFCVASGQGSSHSARRSVDSGAPERQRETPDRRREGEHQPEAQQRAQGLAGGTVRLDRARRLQCTDAARLPGTSDGDLAGGYRPCRVAADRIEAARDLGRARMRVSQYLSGAVAICCRCARFWLRPGQDHAVAPRRS